MPPQSPSLAAQWLLSATIILSLVSNGNSFQTIGADSIRQQHNKITCQTKNNISSVHVVKMSSSFQQARLEEQLRLSTKQRRQAQSEEETVSADTSEDSVPIDNDSSLQPDKEAKDLLELENEILGPDGLPELAPMMTYQKYLTMQVRFYCCVDINLYVGIRFSLIKRLKDIYVHKIYVCIIL